MLLAIAFGLLMKRREPDIVIVPMSLAEGGVKMKSLPLTKSPAPPVIGPL